MPWGCHSRTRDRAAWILVAAFLVACPAQDGPATPTDPPSAAATPSGGRVAVGVFGEPATLDPYSRFASDLTYTLVRPIYRSLYRMQPDGTPTPDLAESIEVLPGGARVVLADASWTDGSPITASDVAASIRRARKPSGFAAVTSARVLDPHTIEMRGAVQDWPLALARTAFVLPRGRTGPVSGPWTVVERVPGLKIVYEPAVNASPRPLLDRLTVFFTDSDATLRSLLEEGDIDVAQLPASTNLPDRLDELGLRHSSARGSEVIALDLTRADMTREQRGGFVSSLPLEIVGSRLVRDLGARRELPALSSLRPPTVLRITVPEGDELLGLIQRAFYERLTSMGHDVDLASVDTLRIYARSPEGILLKRLNVVPGDDSEAGIVVLYETDSVVAFTDRVGGVEVNPWPDGVLWNAETWSVAPE
jgi:Bacterial extracellular solute-binding proteins, family 5 Middle